jgi:hypothetical protein
VSINHWNQRCLLDISVEGKGKYWSRGSEVHLKLEVDMGRNNEIKKSGWVPVQ